jgi:DNA-binding transcriptional LysR family regulator
MDIHHLKIFAAVYRHRSFSRASEELRISQPTISEHIKNLELELDCKLFDRLGRSIIPTPQAELILAKALQIVDEVAAIPDLVMQAGTAIRGHLLIGASTIPGTYLLPVLAARFKKAHPDVSFEIRIHDTCQIAEMLAGHELLLGVVGARVEQKQLSLHPFCNDTLICAGIPELAGHCRAQALPAVPFLQREQGSGTRTVTEKLLKERGIDPAGLDIAATLGSTAAIKEAIKAGLGVSILSRMAISEELATGRLEEIALAGPAMTRSFYLLRHKKRSLPAHYQAFYDLVSQAFSPPPA